MEATHKQIENVSNIKSAHYATDSGKKNSALCNYLKDDLGIELNIIDNISDVTGSIVDVNSDIFFIDQNIQGDNESGVKLCHHLRTNGYKGIIILCTSNNIDEEVSNSLVTSIGFDNYLPHGCSLKILLNQLHWAILNRRRKNKNILQFDSNPDALYTIDKNGIIHDINDTATINSPYCPKEIVTGKIDIKGVGTLPTFDEHIRRYIKMENVGEVFEHTSDEDGVISQVKVMISNMPVIGLVASVFKTNITKVMFARTLDILTNSITLLNHRDHYTAGHSSRVFHYCMNIAKQMDLTSDNKFLKSLYCAALLHDVGKIGIKDDVLLKPGRLSASEFKELASHPIKGCDILRRYNFLRDSVDFIKSHHERPDGRGYPSKLTGDDIPLGAAIISVADSFDAMTTTRPYRSSLDYEHAVKEVEMHAGTQFNNDVAQAFLSVITPDIVKKISKISHKTLGLIAREILDLLGVK